MTKKIDKGRNKKSNTRIFIGLVRILFDRANLNFTSGDHWVCVPNLVFVLSALKD